MKQQVLHTAQQMNALGINQGSAGNVSIRTQRGDGFFITPSGMPYQQLHAEQIVEVSMDGRYQGDLKPSSEWRFHRDILQARDDVHAVVHTHSRCATSLACLNQSLPPFHYMIAVAGGSTVRCAPYAIFGSQQLSDFAVTALTNRKACLLANHGLIAVGATASQALAIAQEIEQLCDMYLRALQIGQPVILSDQQMAEVLEKFKDYGV